MPTALLPELLNYVLDQWPAFFPGQRRPRSLSYILQGTGVGKLIIFVLAAGEARPRCVLKIARSRRENESLAHEHWMITELRRRRGSSGSAQLPEPLAALVVQGWQVVVEKMLPGSLFSSVVPMGERFGRSVARDHLRRVRDWLVAWQRAAYPEMTPLTANDIQTLLVEPIKTAQRTADLRPHELAFLDQVGQRAESLV